MSQPRNMMIRSLFSEKNNHNSLAKTCLDIYELNTFSGMIFENSLLVKYEVSYNSFTERSRSIIMAKNRYLSYWKPKATERVNANI